jgi:RimJ/RimL family protein N-acetyltransferase
MPPVTGSPFLIETDRLSLREYVPEDLEDLLAILGDPETMRFYPAPYSRQRTIEWVNQNIERYRVDGFGLWAMILRETGGFVGSCGPVRRTIDGRDEVELGWHVQRSRWGQGLAPEAAAACRDHAFAVLGQDRLISLVRPVNVQSRRVAEKIGMTVDKHVEHAGMDHLVYAIERAG